MGCFADDEVAQPLNQADEQQQNKNADISDVHLVALVAVTDGKVAQPPAAHRAGHSRQADQADKGDGRGAHNAGNAFAQVDAGWT